MKLLAVVAHEIVQMGQQEISEPTFFLPGLTQSTTFENPSDETLRQILRVVVGKLMFVPQRKVDHRPVNPAKFILRLDAPR